VWVAVAAVAAAATPVAAHGTVTGFSVPVPAWYLAVGAGLAVAATALVLATRGDGRGGERRGDDTRGGERRGDDTRGGERRGDVPSSGDRPLVTLPDRTVRAAATAVRWGFLLAVAAAVAHGVVGPASFLGNLATVLVWPLWLKGVGLVAVVAGSPWRVLAPWRALYDALSALEGRQLQVASYPEWAGRWPALAGGVVLVVGENLTVLPRDPGLTAAFVAGGTLLLLAGGVTFGPVFFDRADPLAVLYGLLGRVSPVQVVRARRSDGAGRAWEVRVRPPWRGCEHPVGDHATAAFAVLAVYAVGFDGLVESAPYRDVAAVVREGVGPGVVASLTPFLAGAAVAGLAFVAAALGANRAAEGVADGRPVEGTTDGGHGSVVRSFAPTLLPIAAGYEVAHNLDYVVVFLGRLPAVIEVAPAVSPLEWVPVGAVWTAQVGLVVAGHVVAVVAAHAVSSGLARAEGVVGGGEGGAHRSVGRGATLRVHAPVVVLMVAYTVWSLWVLTLPVAV
jgi:hypothetical protein